MKNIVVALDFSDCSVNALEHAVTIAQKGNYDINLVWVNNPTFTKITLSSDKAEEMLSEVKSQFDKLITKYSKLLPNNSIFYNIREGKVYHQVALEAKEKSAVLIVAGTHGTSGFEEFWIGSNAYKIVSLSPCPVITIRGGVSVNRELTKIVFPVDSTPETRQKALFTSDVAHLFNAKVHILALYTSGISSLQESVNVFANQIKKFFDEEKIECQLESMRTGNIAKSTIEYAMSIEANLISIMTEQETSTANLWLGTYAQQIINHSPIPVLSIHPKDLNIVLGP